jgi:hypothetical protein
MSLKQKLKMLSKKMCIIGKMHPSYKGLAMNSGMSPEIQKSTLVYFMKYMNTDLSLIYVDFATAKITWYNQLAFLEKGSAILCIKDRYICVKYSVNQESQDTTVNLLSTFLYQDKDLCRHLLDCLAEFDIFASPVIYDVLTPQQPTGEKDDSLLMSLVNYTQPMDVYASVTKAEKLRLLLGEHIYKDIYENCRTPTNIAQEFDTYLNRCEKIVYVMC